MQNEIKKYKEQYYKIGYIVCPVLNNKKVYFNNKGFAHLVRKGRKFRSKKEQKRRFALLKYVRHVLLRGYIHEKRSVLENDRKIFYWSVVLFINKNKITVILRKINKRDIHFYSIFDK